MYVDRYVHFSGSLRGRWESEEEEREKHLRERRSFHVSQTMFMTASKLSLCRSKFNSCVGSWMLISREVLHDTSCIRQCRL